MDCINKGWPGTMVLLSILSINIKTSCREQKFYIILRFQYFEHNESNTKGYISPYLMKIEDKPKIKYIQEQ